MRTSHRRRKVSLTTSFFRRLAVGLLTEDRVRGRVLITSADVDEAEAQSSKLVEVGIDGSVHIRVDSTPKVSGSRASVKLVSQKTCDGGLFIADIERTPQVSTRGSDWSGGGS